MPLYDSAANVLHYWDGIGSHDKQMWGLANVVFGAAPTQVSVERTFSTLRWVLSDLRKILGEARLEEILLLKLNNNFK